MAVLTGPSGSRSIIPPLLLFTIAIWSIANVLALSVNSKPFYRSHLCPGRQCISFVRTKSVPYKGESLQFGALGDSKTQFADELIEERDVFRGELKNGLKYSFYRKDIPEIQAYLQVCSGSADEEDDQRGIAHMCEHVVYMGSARRNSLNVYGVKANAYTDYNNTVFYVKTDSDMRLATKRERLGKILWALVDVIEAPTQFNEYQLNKERKAILSEARIITTAEYLKNCKSVEILHDENILPLRYPIGDLEKMESYRLEDLIRFHAKHYIPDNIRLFIQGGLDPADVSATVEEKFSHLKNPTNLKQIQLQFKNTEKARRRGLPPVIHNYRQKDPAFKVWCCDNLPCFSFEILKKLPLPRIRNYSELFDNTLNKLAYKIVMMHFSIMQRDSQMYSDVNANDYDCINEGCRVRSLNIKCDQENWKNSVFYVLSEVGRFLGENIGSSFLDYAKDSLVLDFEGAREEEDSTGTFIENEVCDRVNLSRQEFVKLIKRAYGQIDPSLIRDRLSALFSWYKKDLGGVKVLASSTASDVTLDDVKRVFYESIDAKIRYRDMAIKLPGELYTQRELEDISSRSSSTLLQPLNKNFHTPSFESQEYERRLPENQRAPFLDYYNNFREYLEALKGVAVYRPVGDSSDPDLEDHLMREYRCDPNERENVKYAYSLINSNKKVLRTKPCTLYEHMLNDSEAPKSGRTGISNESHTSTYGLQLYTLNNNVKVNCKTTEDYSLTISANIPIVDYVENNMMDLGMTEPVRHQQRKINKLMTILVAAGLMESGSMGSLDRRAVELFCELNSINVSIATTYDYLNITIQMHLNDNAERANKQVEYCLQILNSVLENHAISKDEFDRAKSKLLADRNEYLKNIYNYGIGEVTSNMSGGALGLHDLDLGKLEGVTYQTLLEATNKIFNSTPKEVSVASSIDPSRLKDLVLKYLSSSAIASKPDGTSTAKEEDVKVPETLDHTQLSEPLGNFYRKNMVYKFEDVTDKALVILAGHAPNSSGFLPNGKHMSTLLEETLKATAEGGSIDKIAVLRRELWMHPAFPIACADLFSTALGSDLFTNMRTMRNLTYDTNINVYTNDIADSYFVITAFSNNVNYPVVLAEMVSYLKRVAEGGRSFGSTLLESAKRQIRDRHVRNEGVHFTRLMSGIQLPEATAKNRLTLTEYDEVLDKITPEDFALLISSQAYGIDPDNLYTRALYSTISES